MKHHTKSRIAANQIDNHAYEIRHIEPDTSLDYATPLGTDDSARPRVIVQTHTGTGRYFIREVNETSGQGRGERSSGVVADPERSRRESSRRSRGRLVAYVLANVLSKMVTLTFDDASLPYSRDEAMNLLIEFRRRQSELLKQAGFGKLPLLAVIEGGDERWHIHIAVHADYPMWVLRKAWPHGTLDISQRVFREGFRQQGFRSRLIELANYMAKNFGDVEGTRYTATHDFHPSSETLDETFESFEDAVAWITEQFTPDVSVWRSDLDDNWPGPTVWIVQLN
jgi:hypothetical protein